MTFVFFRIISNTPISTQLEKVWNKIHKQGWVSIEATHQLQSLLNTGAPCWFITNVLKVMYLISFKKLQKNLKIFSSISGGNEIQVSRRSQQGCGFSVRRFSFGHYELYFIVTTRGFASVLA